MPGALTSCSICSPDVGVLLRSRRSRQSLGQRPADLGVATTAGRPQLRRLPTQQHLFVRQRTGRASHPARHPNIHRRIADGHARQPQLSKQHPNGSTPPVHRRRPRGSTARQRSSHETLDQPGVHESNVGDAMTGAPPLEPLQHDRHPRDRGVGDRLRPRLQQLISRRRHSQPAAGPLLPQQTDRVSFPMSRRSRPCNRTLLTQHSTTQDTPPKTRHQRQKLDRRCVHATRRHTRASTAPSDTCRVREQPCFRSSAAEDQADRVRPPGAREEVIRRAPDPARGPGWSFADVKAELAPSGRGRPAGNRSPSGESS